MGNLYCCLWRIVGSLRALFNSGWRSIVDATKGVQHVCGWIIPLKVVLSLWMEVLWRGDCIIYNIEFVTAELGRVGNVYWCLQKVGSHFIWLTAMQDLQYLQAGVNVDSDVRFSRFFATKCCPMLFQQVRYQATLIYVFGENSFSAFISLPSLAVNSTNLAQSCCSKHNSLSFTCPPKENKLKLWGRLP